MTEMYGDDGTQPSYDEPQSFGEPASDILSEIQTLESELGGGPAEPSMLLENTGAVTMPTDANPFMDEPEKGFTPALNPELFKQPEPEPYTQPNSTNPAWMDPSSPLYQEPVPVFERSATDIDPGLFDRDAPLPPELDRGMTQDDDRYNQAQEPPADPADKAGPVDFEFPNVDTTTTSADDIDLF